MSQPRKVAQAFDFYSVSNANVAHNATLEVPFTPIDYKADGAPVGAPGGSVPVLIAHEVLVSNPGSFAILVTPATIQASKSTTSFLPDRSTMKPAYVDPTSFPAVTTANAITVPAGAVAFPIRVRCYGVTISSPNGDTTPTVTAYGPLSLQG